MTGFELILNELNEAIKEERSLELAPCLYIWEITDFKKPIYGIATSDSACGFAYAETKGEIIAKAYTQFVTNQTFLTKLAEDQEFDATRVEVTDMATVTRKSIAEVIEDAKAYAETEEKKSKFNVI